MYFIANVACFFFGVVVPTCASILTIDTKSTEDETQWLMYWVVYAVYMSIEKLLSKAILYVPFYEGIKLVGILWLIAPQTKGATLIYQSVIQPAVQHVIQMPVVQHYLQRLDHPLARQLSGRKAGAKSK
eukprot:jgi/Pico_ML_1/55516/g1191.t1